MLPPLETREAHATELLRVCCSAAARLQLLRYATKATGSREAGEECYQQALLDAHDAVQRNGFAGTREQDYLFYVLAVIKRRAGREAQRATRRVPLADLPECAVPDGPEPNAAAHLAGQIAAYVQQEATPADRVAWRLHLDGYSTRQIEALTGRSNRTVAWALAGLKETLRRVFRQAWDGLAEE